MKTVISTGKGGVGKTTTISSVATMMAREGRKVVVFDTDPSMNLAMTLGIPFMEIPTIADERDEIGRELEEDGISEIGRKVIEEHSKVNADGIRVVVMGAIEHGGGGCLCAPINLVKMLLNYLGSDRCEEKYDIAFVDSQAGPEILGRGLAREFDCNAVLTEPTPKSAEVSRQVVKMAKDLEVKNNLLIINKSESEEDIKRMSSLVGLRPDEAVRIRYDRSVIQADRNGETLMDAYPESDAVKDLTAVKKKIEQIIGM
jgi:CO dehydrogenase maturation factor